MYLDVVTGEPVLSCGWRHHRFIIIQVLANLKRSYTRGNQPESTWNSFCDWNQHITTNWSLQI